MTNSKLLTKKVAAVVIAASIMAGCGAQVKGDMGEGNSLGSNPSSVLTGETAGSTNSEHSADAGPSGILEQEVIIYGTDVDQLEVVERAELLQYTSDEDLLKAAIHSMKQGDGDQIKSLWESIEFLSIELADGLATLDIHIPDDARMGAPGELLALQTLQSTLFQFEFIHSIQLLVDGEQVESIMGHVELEHPIVKP